jgi:hypothetical protein
MQNKIWYGVHQNEPRFAKSEQALTDSGVTNPQSFTVTGDVSGLLFIDDQNQSQQNQSSQQTA